MIDLVEIIRDFVANLDLSGQVLSHSDDGTNTTLNLSNSYHLREKMSLNVDGTDYTVVSVDTPNNQAVVSGVIADPASYAIAPPFFFHGTYYIVSSEFDLKTDAERLPMFYMEKSIREVVGGRGSAIATTPDFRFILADWANYADWLPDDYNEKRILGLRRLAWAVRQQAIEYRKKFQLFEDTSFEIETMDKFGVQARNKGSIENLFNHTLSAVSIRVSIPIKNCIC
jgi:hypothetical protein